MYDLKALIKATDRAIALADKAKSDFEDETINWSCLRCEDAQLIRHADGKESYTVIIEEADTNSWEFQQFIREELSLLGFENIEVRTG